MFPEPYQPVSRHVCPVIGIGASAGGLEAVNETLGAVSDPTKFAYVIVQHLDPTHLSMMAELMDRRTELEVRQIEGGEVLQAGHAYVIPPGKNLKIISGTLELTSFEEPRGIRRPIDDFFMSLATDQGPNAACIVLSGTGADGAAGLRAIKERGGIAVAQKPSTAKFDGMPMAAISTGLVDFILAPDQIFDRLESYFASHKDLIEAQSPISFLSDHIIPICAALKKSVGHDFSGYKRSTMTRRILRRMQVLEIDEASDYLARLKSDDRECDALLRDLTINVTGFYRNPEAWEKLSELAIPEIVKGKAEGETIRAWVPGCSSGEEAFTLAMLIAEEMSRQKRFRDVQIFATDIDMQMLSQARDAQYSVSSMKDLPARLRETYTFAAENAFQIMPRIRSMVQFSSHSVIKDPPFSKLDLISCRNLLIYLGDEIQSSLLPLFHYALRPDRFLFLGNSETIGRFEDFFETTDQKSRIFSRLPGKAIYPLNFPLVPSEKPKRKSYDLVAEIRPKRLNLADEKLLSTYVPTHILIDSHGDIIRSYGKLGPYLEFPSGAPSTNLKSLARNSFRDVLLPLLRESRDSRHRQALKDVKIFSEFGSQTVDVIVDPLPDDTTLILLLEHEAFRTEIEPDVIETLQPIDQVRDLEEELHLTRFRLRATVEELETANEELKSSNEEMMSMNEELQSSNEELSTVNEELKTKADQLTFVNADMRHFIESTDLALVILDSDLKVRTYTDAIRDIYPLKISDRGRPLIEVASLIDDETIISDAKSVLEGGPAIQRLVVRSDGTQSYSMRILPFMRELHSITGVTITFSDVSRLKNAEIALQNQTERLRLAITAAEMGIWDFDADSRLTTLDSKTKELFSLKNEGPLSLDAVMNSIQTDDAQRVKDSLNRALSENLPYREEFRIVDNDKTVRWLQGVGKRVDGPNGSSKMLGVIFDITAQTEAVNARDLLIREMNHRVKNLFSVIIAMVTLASKREDDKNSMAKALRSQIGSLGNAHDVSYANDTLQVRLDFEELLKRMLAPFLQNNNILFEGESVGVKNDALTPLSLILHEWATNSAKYGVFSQSEGTLALTWDWTSDKAEEVFLQWREQGLVDIEKPDEQSKGFGSRLVELSVEQLGGTIRTEWKPSELIYNLTIPSNMFD